MLAHITIVEVVPWVAAVSGGFVVGGVAGFLAARKSQR